MERNFIPLGAYESILEIVGRWNIINIKNILPYLPYEITYNGLYRQIKKLIKEGYLAAFKIQKNEICVYLTNSGLKIAKSGSDYSNSKELINHDYLASSALRELLKYKNFISGELITEHVGMLQPDAIIFGKEGEGNYSLGLEIELNQKNKDLIREKFRRYGQSYLFAYCLYVTNKPSVFESYIKVLQSLIIENKVKFIFLLSEKLNVMEFDYLKGKCWHNDEIKTFEEIFG